jgi:LPXTG-motif cell wall-anchored protein
VIVSNGAQACNVFWQVGSSATLGTGSTFKGTIMALASISVTTGVDVEGRALSRNGAVTLDTNDFTTPNCATTTTTTSVTASPSTTGGTTTLTATVASTAVGGASPTEGTVTFTEGGTTLGTAPVNSAGVATLVIPSGAAVVTRAFAGSYNGFLSYGASTAVPISLAVAAAPLVPTPTPTTAVPTLAATGTSDTGALLATSAGLLLVGSALVLFVNRRRRYVGQH